jgi:hypothetical protein
MKKTLALIHTGAILIPVFQQLAKARLPGVELFNIVDDSLVRQIGAKGGITPMCAQHGGLSIEL